MKVAHLVKVSDGFNIICTKELTLLSYQGLDNYYYKGVLYKGYYDLEKQTIHIYLYRPYWS